MFSFIKNKYYFKDLIPKNYIDIHNHILPGIDDGSKNIEETNRLIEQMKSINISAVIPTPHTFTGLWNNTPETIKNSYNLVHKYDINSSFFIRYASEYMLDSNLIHNSKKGPLLCLIDNYVLIEFNLFCYPVNLYEMLFELKLQGYKIIIAHPERYLYFHNDFRKLTKLKEFGAYFQLNLLSLTGYYGKEIQKIAEKLLEVELYDFTGTDIHNEQQIKQFSTKPFIFSKKNYLADLMKENNIFNPIKSAI